MANVIIGTAGHIDHGKTTLIKRLTGIDTDRLKEEKKRGITIELGFAYFDLPSGKRAGIVDVPGHERFIRNMLAGASGIDIVLLVISAEEGFMPQTQEHFDILTLLDVKKGIVVLTKSDLVDQEWKDIVKQDITDKIAGSFLEGAPIVEVSAITGEGMDLLTSEIDRLITESEEKNTLAPARLPIDRVFSMTGFGTIVTGTLVEGSLSEGDILELFPKDVEARVRRIQVHGADVAQAYAGQRVAVNIANLSRDEIERGDILAKKGSLKKSSMLDVRISMLKSTERVLQNWSRLRLYHGSREVFCRLVLLDREALEPGEACYAQLRLEEPTACKYGDHFVLRLYSPLETIGGGTVLDPNAVKHKRFKEDVLEELLAKNSGSKSEVLAKTLRRLSPDFPESETLSVESGLPANEIKDVLAELVEQGVAVVFEGRCYLHIDYLAELENKLLTTLNGFHDKNPLKRGIQREELKSRVLKSSKGKIFDEIISYFVERGTIEMSGNLAKVKGFVVVMEPKKGKKVDAFMKLLTDSGFNPPNFKEMLMLSSIGEKEKDIIDYILESELVIKLDDNVVIHENQVEAARKMLIEYLTEHGEISMAQFRDQIGSSRKVALPLIEYFDNNKLTQRVGDVRVMKK